MQITIDTNNLSDLDIAMLAFLADQEATDPEPEAAAPEPAKTKATKAKAEPAPEPVEEDLLGDSEPEAPTMSDAVAAATQLVSSGSAAKVKEALGKLDVKRVSELTDDQIKPFLAALA